MLLQLNAEAGSGDPERALSCAAKVKFIFTLTGKFIRYTSPVSGWDDLSFIMCALIINMLSNNPQAGCGVETMHICSWGTQSFPKKKVPRNITPSQAGWIHAFTSFTPNSVAIMQMSQQKSRCCQTRWCFCMWEKKISSFWNTLARVTPATTALSSCLNALSFPSLPSWSWQADEGCPSTSFVLVEVWSDSL